MARKYPRGDRGRWGRPAQPFLSDKHRWQRFCRTVEQRIEALRQAEGVDSRFEPWRAFETPLPAVVPARPVRLRLAPAPDLPRGWHGRLMRREVAS